MDNRFKDVETEFRQLKLKYSRREISEQEYREQLKILRLKDKKGRYWTIGAQTGKWYFYDGIHWVQANPPSITEKKAICIFCGFENDLDNRSCMYCGGNFDEEERKCKECGQELEEYSKVCPHCGEEQDIDRNVDEVDIPEERHERHVLKSVNSLSLFMFFGSWGLLIGIILGAFIGASGSLPGVVQILPAFLREVHGNLVGGLFYAILGGMVGFSAIGVLGYLYALVVNIILSFTGGIRIRMDRMD